MALAVVPFGTGFPAAAAPAVPVNKLPFVMTPSLGHLVRCWTPLESALALGLVDWLPTIGWWSGGRWTSSRRTLGAVPQVWPLTQFYLFPFCENSLICLEGKSMTPHRGNTILFRSSQQLPRLRLGPSKGFLSCHGALLGPSTRLVRCFRNYRDTRTPSGVPR